MDRRSDYSDKVGSESTESTESTEWSRLADQIEKFADETGCSYHEAAMRLGAQNPDHQSNITIISALSGEALKSAIGDITSRVCGDCGVEVQPGRKCANIALSKERKFYPNDHPVYKKKKKKPQ